MDANPSWTFSAPAEIAGALHATPTEVIAARTAGGVAAFDAKSGAVRWTHGELPGPAAVAGELVIAYARSGEAAAIGPDGNVRWTVAVKDDRTARQRKAGRRAAVFPADVLVDRDHVILAAGDELVKLALADGRIAARVKPCGQSPSVISRLVRAGDAIAVLCREAIPESEIDDRAIGVSLWEPPAKLEELRPTKRDIVALDAGLHALWHAPQPIERIAHAGAAGDGALVLVGREAADPFQFAAVALEAKSGALRWKRSLDGGPGRHDPVAHADGVVIDGGFYGSRDGALRWKAVLAEQPPPVSVGARLIAASRSNVLMSVRSDGKTQAIAPMGSGTITSWLAIGGGVCYFAISEAGQTTQLRGVQLP